jgi:hypothetical protein
MYRMQEDEELIKGRKEETAETKRHASKGMHISGIGQTVAPLIMPQAPKLLVATPIHQSPNLECIAKKHMQQDSGLDPSPRPSKLPRTDHLSPEQNAFLDASLALFHATNAASPTFPPAAPTHDQNIHGTSPLPLVCTLPNKLMVDSAIPRIPKPGQHQALAPGPLQQASMAVSNRPLVKPRLLQSQTLLKYKKDSVAPGFRIRARPAQPQLALVTASHRPLAKPHVLQAQTLSTRMVDNVTRGTHPTMKTASEHTDCIPIPIPRQILSQPKPLRAPTIPSMRPLTTTSPQHSRHCRRLSTSCLPPALFQHRSNAAESTCTGSPGFRH